MNTKNVVALGVLSASSIVAHAGGVASWNSSVDGSWFVGSNWSTGLVPGGTDQAILGLSGSYTVNIPGIASIGSLSITNSNAILEIDNVRTLDVLGDMFNNGTVVVNPIGGGSATQLDFEADAIVSGSGAIRLGAPGARARLRTGAGFTFTQEAGHLIHGTGQIEGGFVNNGTIRADVAFSELSLMINDKINNSIMEATNGGIIDSSSISVTQGSGGIIRAIGTGSRIDLNSTQIIGGELSSSPDASIDIVNSIFDGVNFSGGIINVLNARSLDVFNSITNNGMIVVNSVMGGSATQLDFENSGSFLGSGSVNLNSPSARARLRTAVGALMTNTENHTIFGQGSIEANLVNNGVIRADVPATEMYFSINDKVNNAIMEAIDGASLDFSSITVNQGPNGQILIDGSGSRLDVNSSTIINGDVHASNGGTIEIVNGIFDNVNFEGTMNVQNARSLDVFNSIVNNGMIVVNSSSGGSATQLDFENSGALLGNGSVQLNSIGARSRIRTGPGAVLTISPDQLIIGRGQIEADMINNGIIRADVAAGEIGFLIHNKTNNNLIEAIDDGILDFSSLTVSQSDDGIIRASGPGSRIDLNSATIEGGSLLTSSGARVDLVNSILDDVDSDGELHVLNARTLTIRNGTTNDGIITVNPISGGSATSMHWADEMILEGSGTVLLNAISARARLTGTAGGIGADQRLEGIGQIGLDFTNNGTIAPGLSLGTMSAIRPIVFGPSATFEVEIDSSGSDLFDNSSTIEIDGALDISFIDGFAPSSFWVRTIMEGSSVNGKFDSISIPTPPAGLVTRVVNTGTQILVGQTCPSDLNLDGTLNFFDVSSFLNDFNSMEPEADLNNDGNWNFFDVSIFLNDFTVSCEL